MTHFEEGLPRGEPRYVREIGFTINTNDKLCK